MAHRVQNVNMRNRGKFRGNRSKHDRDIAIFEFQDSNRPPSWIFKYSKILTVDRVMRVNMRHHMQNFVAIGETVAEIRRYFDFSRWRPPPPWIFKFQIFNGQTAQDSRTAYVHQIWSKSVKPLPRYNDFSIFPRWRPSAILDLLCVCSNHPRRAFGGLYRCAKFGWNRCSSFDDTHVFRFHEFGLKTPIHAPKMRFFGGI